MGKINLWLKFKALLPFDSFHGKIFRMRKLLSKAVSVPVILLLFCIAAYGLLIPTLGFYWDDWPLIWFAHTLGPGGFVSTLAGDRPFLAGIYLITTSILQTVPFQWQLLSMVSRWLSALAFWWTLRQIWPFHKEKIFWAALLFAIYPGFKQQPISVIFSNGLLLFASYIFSLGCMLYAIRKPGRYRLATLLSLLTYAFCFFATEYYIGLDLIRPVLLWLVLDDHNGFWKRILKTLKYWLPFLIVLVLYLIWRIFIFQFPTYQPILLETITSNPTSKIIDLANQIVQDMFNTGLRVWTESFRFPGLGDFSQASTTFYWVVVLFSIIIAGFIVWKINPDENNLDQGVSLHKDWSKIAILLGLFALLVAGWPYWITGLQIGLQYPNDRFTLAFMFGSCLLLAGLVERIIHTRPQKVVILALITGFSIGSSFLNSNSFRRDWMAQKDFFWQLAWRVPGLKPGTLIITHTLAFPYNTDYSLTAPLIWTYSPEHKTKQLPFLLVYPEIRLKGSSLPSLKEGVKSVKDYRGFIFEGNTSNALVIFYSPPGCLRVLDPVRDKNLPILPYDISQAVSISHPAQIITTTDTPAEPPASVFGTEPVHSWCYYYQKADLARQSMNWEKVKAYGDQAFSQGFFPEEPSELMLFIEGYAHAGQWTKVQDMSIQIYHKARTLQNKLCEDLSYVKTSVNVTEEGKSILDQTQKQIECPIP